MLLVIDIGNTNIVMGLYREKDLVHHWRLQTSRDRTADEYGVLVRSLLQHHEIELADVGGVIMSSVVPPLSGVLEAMCERYFDQRPLQVGPGLKTGMPILYENPREVGADRIVNAVAAFSRFQKGGVIVDFGTATTFDAISPRGEYMGGAIAPGIGISAEALFQRASKLPRVEVARPPRLIGRNTVHSMQAGLFFGYVGLIDEITKRMLTEIDEADPFVISTGGLSTLFTQESSVIQESIADLTLEGLRLIYERNLR
ncbi:MAG: type III pantothenate kinase [Myxococcales bacterium]|nr:type III pantothenate kinase [Myxococcales bacterium]MCB9644958.1 type III pantothenate kinase [Myxococcales bacterium]